VADNGPILYSRVSVSRNLVGYNFGQTISTQDKKKILSLVKITASNIDEFSHFAFFDLRRLNQLERELLVESNIITRTMVSKVTGKGVFIKLKDNGSNTISSVMVNEDDHFKIQALTPGLGLYEGHKNVIGLEKQLESKLSFCFDRDLGYLTACPTMVGSGFEASVLVHLPSLVMSFKINDLIKRLNQLNCTLQGYHLEGSEVLGNLFLVSKESSLKNNDIDTVEEMVAICLNIIEEENLQTEALIKDTPISVADNIYRSYGVLEYAQLLSFDEAIELLSMVLLGKKLKILYNLKEFDFYQVINIIGNSYIRSYFGNKDDTEDQVDAIRADILRKEILKGND
jgi:protein arginine kinase